MVELRPIITMGVEATNKGKGRNKKKHKLLTSPLIIIPCKCCHMIVALIFFISKRLCATRFYGF
jgi:hypothetical protein